MLGRNVCGFGIGRGNQDEFIAHKRFGVNSALARWAFDESNGNLGVEQQIHNLLGVAAVHRQLNARMVFEKSSDEAGQDVLGDGCRNAQREFARELSVFGANFPLSGGRESGDFVRVAEKDSALGRESDSIRRAIEETRTQVVLQCFDLERHGRLGEGKMLGGLAKAEMFGDRAENRQAEILQLGHGEDYL